jgi:hypothetical protein
VRQQRIKVKKEAAGGKKEAVKKGAEKKGAARKGAAKKGREGKAKKAPSAGKPFLQTLFAP